MQLGEAIGRIADWMREEVDHDIAQDAINDAIESLWESLVTAAFQNFMDAPVTLSLANASDHLTVVSVADPLNAPDALMVAGGVLPQRAFKVAYTYVTESGSETLISPEVLNIVLANNFLFVNVRAVIAGAIGYNIYARDTNWPIGTSVRVNPVPLAFGIPWREPEDGVFELTDAAGPNQTVPQQATFAPVTNSTGDNIAFIDHLEVQNPDGTYSAWNQADLDSLVMRRLAGRTSSTSTYSNYAWDILGGNRIEIRPATGAALSPRYFPVVRPRRLRVDNANIPFTNLPVDAFIRYFAISLIKLSLEEYEASGIWSQKAEAERASLLKVSTKSNRNRNDRITPYMH